MADPPDYEAAQEELTIQQVILQSLETEDFDGVEEEKRIARETIDSLKAVLRSRGAHHQHEPHGNDQAAAGPSVPYGHSSPALPERRSYQPSPAASGSGSSAMTPHRGQTFRGDEILSLPSRKREFATTAFDGEDTRNKSRRTTPTPSRQPGTPFSTSSRHTDDSFGGDMDIIDLTGDDVQDDAAYVSEQMRREQTRMASRNEQERRDREFALQLSSQDSPQHTAAHSSPQVNAFSRLMQSQRANAHPQQAQQYSDLTEEPDEPNMASQADISPLSYPMPGAFDPTWADPFNSHPAASTPQRGVPNQQPGFRMPNVQANGYYSSPSGIGPHYRGESRFGPGGNGRPLPNFGSPALNAFNSAAALLHGPPLAPTLHSQGYLSELISRTAGFDYTRGATEAGEPFNERLGQYLDHSLHDPRVTDQELEELLQNIRPDMDIPEQNRGGTPAGLKSVLYPHQELALTWMKKMESGTNKGGILADDMGLGKTISTLALMISRPATARPKTNLIVGPVALVRQWEEEIRKKLKLSHKMSVLVYHNCRATVDDLMKYDVVLTTYGTLAQELKKLEKYLEENADRNIDFNDRTLATKCPLLHPKKAVFHRIILDEAQCIKNRKTRTAEACFKLKGTFRWCLTGTPMMNSIEELYSLIHFLQIKPYSHWEKFREAFGRLFGKKGDAKHVAMNRLRALLKATMLRRKKNSTLDGKPILKLPEKTEEVVYAELSPDERDFYGQLEKKSQVLFNKYLRDGSVGKNYSNILVLLLRMRQACCHPHLNLDVDDASPLVTDESILDLVRALEPSTIQRIKDSQGFECPICYDAVQAPSFITPCGHDTCKPCLARVVDNAAANNLQEGNESSGAKCPVCRGSLDPKKCFSYEAFCTIHMPETVKKSESDEEEFSGDEWDDDSDDDADDADKNGNLRGFIVNDDISDDEDRKPDIKGEKQAVVKPKDGDECREENKLPRKSKKGKGKKKKQDIKPSMLKTLRQAAYKNHRAYKTYMTYLKRTWMPAAKVTECMKLLKEIQVTGEKTIIFSQWTLLLDLLEVAMHHDKFEQKPVRYDGSMSGTARNAAAHKFRDSKDVRVMLVSLRAGNAGLNLTAASRVIIMDPFWNPYIEMQAVDRAYRIGQKMPVKVYRVLTKETVEDRIVELQERKKEIVEAALDESEGMKIGRLGINELKFLFNGRS